MATTLKPVDVVLVGMGWTGGILAKELSEAGLRVVGLERGRVRQTVPDFQSPAIHDELRYAVRHELMQNMKVEPITFRNTPDQEALPMRQLGSFLPGTDLGGAGVHWNGQTWRFLPSDFRLRSHHEERYGKGFIPGDLTVQDWGITYEELEPFYDHFEKVCGIGGKAGNLNGTLQPGGNPFEGPRSGEFPNPPMKQAYSGALFGKAAAGLGYTPFPVPSANMTREYTNPYGATLKPCNYCGYCERFACEHFAKSSAQLCVLPAALKNPNFELRPLCHVTRVNLSADRKRATGVTYVDGQGREMVQPAEIVILCAFGINNVRLMLWSGIGQAYDPATGQGTVGRNYSYQTMSSVNVFYPEEVRLNQFMGAGALGTAIDDYNGDNFDHGPLGFLGGGYIAAYTTGLRPIQGHSVPEGTPRWGAEWKAAVRRHYNHTAGISIHGASHTRPTNYISLDPTYRDAFGVPAMRITYDFPENDRKMSDFVTDRALEIGKAMGGTQVSASRLDKRYSIVPYQTTHNTGGAIMGADPRTSVVNRHLQSWEVPNVFVQGACVYPQNPGYNPTGTVGALAYWTAKAIKERYLKDPGPLVRA